MKTLLTIIAAVLCSVAMGQNISKGLPPGWRCSVPNCTYDHSKMYSIPIMDSLPDDYNRPNKYPVMPKNYIRKQYIEKDKDDFPTDRQWLEWRREWGYALPKPDTIKVRIMHTVPILKLENKGGDLGPAKIPIGILYIGGGGKEGVDSLIDYYEQVQPDTIKVRLLLDDGIAVPVQRNAWHFYDNQLQSVFLEENKRKRINQHVWNFYPYEWQK